MDANATGRFIAELRKQKGYTQKELAEKLMVTDKAISRWETGKGLPDGSRKLGCKSRFAGMGRSPYRNDLCFFVTHISHPPCQDTPPAHQDISELSTHHP